jgi:hypothetical protein
MDRIGGCASTTELLDRAQAGDADAFARLVDPYLRELQVHYWWLTRNAAAIARRTVLLPVTGPSDAVR